MTIDEKDNKENVNNISNPMISDQKDVAVEDKKNEEDLNNNIPTASVLSQQSPKHDLYSQIKHINRTRKKTSKNGLVITKKDIAAQLVEEKLVFTHEHAIDIVDNICNFMMNCLVEDKNIKIIELGTIAIKESVSRKFRSKYGREYQNKKKKRLQIRTSARILKLLNPNLEDNEINHDSDENME